MKKQNDMNKSILALSWRRDFALSACTGGFWNKASSKNYTQLTSF